MTDREQTAVCFDLDNTVLSYDRPYEAIVRSGLDPHIESITDTMIEDVMVTLLASLEDLEDDPYHAAAAAALDGGEFDVDPTILLESLQQAELDGTSVSEPARTALETLASQESMTVCLLTDGHHDWQRQKLSHHGIEDHFAHVVTSYDAGGTKATGEPYDYLRDRVEADEYVMIGDDYEGDVEAAREAGFVPIHYEETDGPDFFATLSAML